VKVGDLVLRNNHAPELMGTGVVLDSHENDDGVVYFEVQWLDGLEEDGRMWYDTLELKVISESR
jgi:hypothetical protein